MSVHSPVRPSSPSPGGVVARLRQCVDEMMGWAGNTSVYMMYGGPGGSLGLHWEEVWRRLVTGSLGLVGETGDGGGGGGEGEDEEEDEEDEEDEDDKDDDKDEKEKEEKEE